MLRFLSEQAGKVFVWVFVSLCIHYLIKIDIIIVTLSCYYLYQLQYMIPLLGGPKFHILF